MKRLLFAGIILFSVPVTAQTKAGKVDTVRHAVYYASSKPSALPVLNFSVKEQAAQNVTRSSRVVVIVPSAKRHTKNLSAKELMKTAITENNE